MKIAFSTLGCPGWSWDEIFATAKDMGLDGIEIRGVGNEMFAPKIKALDEAHIGRTRERLEKAGMTIPMLTSGACLGLIGEVDSYLEEAKAYIDCASRIGTPFVRVVVTTNPAPTDEEDLLQAKALYDQLCNYAKGKNVCVLIETAGMLADSRAMKSFMRGVDPESGGVLWDLHHPYRYFHEAPAETYALIGPWVKYMRVKDSVVQDKKIVYRMMGYGDVPVFDALKLLDDNGYTGFISLEWVKRWNPDLQEPGIVFAHFINYMNFLKGQLK